MREVGQAYARSCPGAVITVTAISTFNGLNALNNATQIATTQIAMSDGPVPGGYTALTGHPVAVIVFGVVVNRQAGVFNLTTAQLRGMFSGTITNWRQVGGANLPVRLVGPGIGAVEQGGYPFWTVEYLYTYGPPAPRSLAAAFLKLRHRA